MLSIDERRVRNLFSIGKLAFHNPFEESPIDNRQQSSIDVSSIFQLPRKPLVGDAEGQADLPEFALDDADVARSHPRQLFLCRGQSFDA